MKNPITLLTCLVAASSLQGAEIITSDGAWSITGVNASSSGGAQANSNTGGTFSNFGGPSYNTNAETQFMDMQTTATNVHQNYTAGYTYTYTGNARGVNDLPNQVASLTANGAVVSGTRITAASGNGTWAPNTSTHTVSVGNSVIGQTIGLRLSSEGIQSRYSANGAAPAQLSTVSALLTDHAGFIGDGVIHSVDYSTGAAVETDFVLDMADGSVGGFGEDYYRINNNLTDQNTLSWGSTDDTIRAGTIYTLTFTASQALIDDPTQTGIDVFLGTASVNFETIARSGNPTTEYTAVFDADALGIAGQALDFSFISDDTTDGGVNQFRFGSIELAAVPEPSSYALLAGSLALAWVMVRRRS